MDASMARLLTANSTLRAGRACVDDLSDDTLTEIASYLTAGDVGKLAQVSRRFASVGADRVVWQGLLDRDFGDGGARRTRSARPGAGGGGGNGRGEGGGMGMTRDASRMASYGSMLMHSLGQSGKRMFGRVGGGGGSGGALAAAAAGVGSYRPVNNDVEAGFAGSAAGAGGAGAGSGGSGYGASGSSAAAAAGPDPRAAYMSRFGEVRTGRQKARAATADATALAAAKHRARKLRVCLDACTYFAGLGLPCALIGLTILLIVLKAANKVALGWESVFAPLWLGCGACFSACVVGCCVQCCSYGVPQESIWRDQEAGEAVSDERSCTCSRLLVLASSVGTRSSAAAFVPSPLLTHPSVNVPLPSLFCHLAASASAFPSAAADERVGPVLPRIPPQRRRRVAPAQHRLQGHHAQRVAGRDAVSRLHCVPDGALLEALWRRGQQLGRDFPARLAVLPALVLLPVRHVHGERGLRLEQLCRVAFPDVGAAAGILHHGGGAPERPVHRQRHHRHPAVDRGCDPADGLLHLRRLCVRGELGGRPAHGVPNVWRHPDAAARLCARAGPRGLRRRQAGHRRPAGNRHSARNRRLRAGRGRVRLHALGLAAAGGGQQRVERTVPSGNVAQPGGGRGRHHSWHPPPYSTALNQLGIAAEALEVLLQS